MTPRRHLTVFSRTSIRRLRAATGLTHSAQQRSRWSESCTCPSAVNGQEKSAAPAALIGTPSQVEWALRIRALVNEDFDRVARSFRLVALKQSARKRADTTVILAILEDKRTAVMSRCEAGYFIHDWQEIDDQVRKMIAQDPRYQAIRKRDSMETKKMSIRPLYDRIVVKRSEEQETSRNGIIIPDSAKEKPQEGEVIAVGHGKRLDDGTLVALGVKAGDRILFGKYSGSETKLDGTEYIIIKEDDVLGILHGAAEKTAA